MSKNVFIILLILGAWLIITAVKGKPESLPKKEFKGDAIIRPTEVKADTETMQKSTDTGDMRYYTV